ncbi:hypothetical protein FNV43_RR18477 [Rhamnella rubrinervis]|uniref:EDR1/CTR1/ARMC3-like peptidase-like domain-containing protein n=1 Tax=Rhamnella rubrinervis TaxID=2594499 RepID=A0A8K0E0T7_9ROSA|nr:hypothetical protein FNV43_RR18477 [Rhamnella rubrinervis]
MGGIGTIESVGDRSTVDSGCADFNFLEEEFQVQLALAISASDPNSREDPESAQIDAVKRISLGGSATVADSRTLVDILTIRYWMLNVSNYCGGRFYDVYGVTSNSLAQGKMPLLVDLKAISVSDNVDYEVLLVNRLIDPELQQLEKRAYAISRENLRALLFKVLADRINLPCMLVKGSYYTGTDDGAVNFIKTEDGSEYIIDLMGAPGALIPAEVPSSQLPNSFLDMRLCRCYSDAHWTRFVLDIGQQDLDEDKVLEQIHTVDQKIAADGVHSHPDNLRYDPFLSIKHVYRALNEEQVYKPPMPSQANSCQRYLRNGYLSDDKAIGMETVNHGFSIGCGDQSERIQPMLGGFAEWEILWEDLELAASSYKIFYLVGSYGEVYHAEWNGTEVAVKKFLDQDVSGDALLQFKCEVEIMLRLRHQM